MKTFYQLLGNNVIASVTNFTIWFALTYFALLETKSVLATSIFGGIYLVMTSFSGFWFGGIVDHNRKKNVMLLSSCISLAIYAIAFALYLLSPPEAFRSLSSPTLWIFGTLLLIGVVAGNLRSIAMPTIVGLLVPEGERDKANGLVGMAFGASFLVVSVISGFLVGWAGMYYPLLLGIVLGIAGIIHLLTIPVKENKIVHGEDKPKTLDIRGTIAIINSIPGLFALIFFTTFNNFLGGVFMSLMDAYGLSLMSVQMWGLLWGGISTAFIVGGSIISKFGLGKNPLRSLFFTNITIWTITIFFTIQPSIILLAVGSFIYMCVVPFIEASEQTIIQKVVPHERQGRAFGFAQSVEQAATPLTAFVIGPVAQFFFIPFMTDGYGAQLIGSWYGTGTGRGIALVFTITGIIGLTVTLLAMGSRFYRTLSKQYLAA